MGGGVERFGQLVRAVWAARAGGRPNAVCAALCGELRELPGRARLAANLASGVRGKELHTSLVPDKEVVVPVTVGLPVAGTRSCTNQDKKSMKITLNILVESVDECISR